MTKKKRDEICSQIQALAAAVRDISQATWDEQAEKEKEDLIHSLVTARNMLRSMFEQ